MAAESPMVDQIHGVARQLERMRGMTRYYHERFFTDTRFVALAVLSLLVVGWWAVPEAFLLIPVVALLGANQTAFDASYLLFARHYAQALERTINAARQHEWLIGARLEDEYLFPLNDTKVVTIGFGRGFSWFGWMTALYTALGFLGYFAGLLLGWDTLVAFGPLWSTGYVVVLAALTLCSLAVGWWWFVRGTGEARLRAVIEPVFGPAPGS